MVGIVIVSHSEQLARGIEELLRQMVAETTPIALAAGSPTPDAPIGTEPMRVQRAIETVYSDDGVVVLMDLGSAIMSAEAARDFLTPTQRQRVHLCEAPLVEGAVAAALAAAHGAPLEKVLADARNALTFKHAQLAPTLSPAPDDAALNPKSCEPAMGASRTLTLLTANRLGIHARPAARLVEIAGRFTASVIIEHGDKRANAASINQLIALNVRQGDIFSVHATGNDALAALAAIQSLAARNFGDDLDHLAAPTAQPATSSSPGSDELSGLPASAGVAIGPVTKLDAISVRVVEARAADPEREWSRLSAAIQTGQAELARLRAETATTAGVGVASIFDAHTTMLHDPDLLGAVRAILDQERLSAESAWQRAIDAVADDYRRLDNPYLARRSADVLDVGQRVLRHLIGDEHITRPASPVQPIILAGFDLRPSDLLQFAREYILGIVTEAGGVTGHSAILARALGIPMVVGVGEALRQVAEGQEIALDGAQGRVWLSPSASLRETFRRTQPAQDSGPADADLRLPAMLRDGKRIALHANIDGPGDVAPALLAGAEGVGVFRTEYLLLGRAELPGEDEQFHVYRAIAERLEERPLIVRTFDIGGDKPISFLKTQAEANPFLGRRGIRLCLDEPALFRPQLRALLRAAVGFDIKIMLPMVSTLEEVLQTRAILRELHEEMAQAGVTHRIDVDLGVMIETPAAVLSAPALARAVDFMSVGTNDLTQYVMAADRNNPNVSPLVSAFQPAVLHALSLVGQAGRTAGIQVGVCGEMAADVRATPLLIGLGVEELSMSAPAIARIKTRVRQLDLAAAQEMAARALALTSAAEVEGLVQVWGGEVMG